MAPPTGLTLISTCRRGSAGFAPHRSARVGDTVPDFVVSLTDIEFVCLAPESLATRFRYFVDSPLGIGETRSVLPL